MVQGFNNFSRYVKLREKYPWFSYEAYNYRYTGELMELEFVFNLSGKFTFRPVVTIPYKASLFTPFDELSPAALDNLVFHAGMVELVSYWKAACPPSVMIKPASLSPSQVDFWKKLYFNGLGEFFYLNSIPADYTSVMNLEATGDQVIQAFSDDSLANCLVPVGGGKDSAVTLGLLNHSGVEWIPLSINPLAATRRIIAAAGKSENDTIVIHREIDPLLLRLNSEGFLNGHTPFSALLGFYSLLAAYLTGRKDIILSNESSANEPTIPGTHINHQYSKSFEFELDFRDYVREHICRQLNYFSMLRPLREINIASLFSGMPWFHREFRSCNVGSKRDEWCGQCPKCLFTFIILSPFLQPSELESIFGKNLLDDPSLGHILDDLTGRSETKPFDCIGTIDEVKLALENSVKQYSDRPLPFLLQHFIESGMSEIDPEVSLDLALRTNGEEHRIPSEYLRLLIDDQT